ncbi:hypothetical protein PCE1_000683 [Barthelona sp. PCE]
MDGNFSILDRTTTLSVEDNEIHMWNDGAIVYKLKLNNFFKCFFHKFIVEIDHSTVYIKKLDVQPESIILTTCLEISKKWVTESFSNASYFYVLDFMNTDGPPEYYQISEFDVYYNENDQLCSLNLIKFFPELCTCGYLRCIQFWSVSISKKRLIFEADFNNQYSRCLYIIDDGDLLRFPINVVYTFTPNIIFSTEFDNCHQFFKRYQIYQSNLLFHNHFIPLNDVVFSISDLSKSCAEYSEGSVFYSSETYIMIVDILRKKVFYDKYEHENQHCVDAIQATIGGCAVFKSMEQQYVFYGAYDTEFPVIHVADEVIFSSIDDEMAYICYEDEDEDDLYEGLTLTTTNWRSGESRKERFRDPEVYFDIFCSFNGDTLVCKNYEDEEASMVFRKVNNMWELSFTTNYLVNPFNCKILQFGDDMEEIFCQFLSEGLALFNDGVYDIYDNGNISRVVDFADYGGDSLDFTVCSNVLRLFRIDYSAKRFLIHSFLFDNSTIRKIDDIDIIFEDFFAQCSIHRLNQVD